MIDPKTLKPGDVVVFGGNTYGKSLERVVGQRLSCGIRWEHVSPPTLDEEPWWCIAELKKPELPDLRQIGFARRDNGYLHPRGGTCSAQYILDRCREAVADLEEYVGRKV